MNCDNQINNSTRNYYKRSFCCCSVCKQHEIDQHMRDFVVINPDIIYCKVCSINIHKNIILEHVNLLSHCIYNITS